MNSNASNEILEKDPEKIRLKKSESTLQSKKSFIVKKPSQRNSSMLNIERALVTDNNDLALEHIASNEGMRTKS